MSKPGKVLVTGATGYVGGRLIPVLLKRGYRVGALSRRRRKLEGREWAGHPNVELLEADVLDRNKLTEVCGGWDHVYYLVHSLGAGADDFEQVDRQAAVNMVRAAEASDVSRIIYLGGLGGRERSLSKHLRSRAEVAQILREGSVPTTVLRAAIILGSGSASFETIRYLVERLPVMITPRWVDTPCQPIAIRNVLEYLAGCLEHPETTGESYDIGGSDIMSYRKIMQTYAKVAGLSRRWILPVPVLSPKLSSYWIHLVTPVPASIARPLIEGLRNPVICEDNRIRDIIPQTLLSVREAMEISLERYRHARVDTHWSDAGSLPPPEWWTKEDPSWSGGTLFVDHRVLRTDGSTEDLWIAITKIGGRHGWYFAHLLWWLRGMLDRLLGGSGLRRGRRHPDRLEIGDPVDFWRVLEVEEGKRLVLHSEMKLPGRAVLEFRLEPVGDKETELHQIARFAPRGLGGLVYWYSVLPFHNYVFNGMITGIAREAGVSIRDGPKRE